MESSITSLPRSPTCYHTPPTWPGLMRLPPDFVPDQSNLPTSEETRGMDLEQWERMQAFHALPTTWSPIFQLSDTELAGESVLVRMMCQPYLDTAWCQTYAWTEEVDFQLATYPFAPSSSATASLPYISQAMWNHWPGPNSNQPTDCVKFWDHYQRRQETLAQLRARDSWQHRPACPDTCQWEQMRAFYLNVQLWPSKVRLNPTGEQGRSPLVWTTLYPPSEMARQQTYVWDSHLDHFMPWTIHTPERPPLTSYAMWNIRQRPHLPPSQKRTKSLERSSHCLPQDPVLSTKQPALTCQSNGSIRPKPHGLAAHTPNPHPPDPVNLPHQIAPNPKSSSHAWIAILMYLLFPKNSDTGSTKMPITLPVTRHWNHSQLRSEHVVKSRKSCSRWTTAIIQHIWDTAWDLTAH